MISSRARYAARALLDLCLRNEGCPVLIQEIADRQNIPLKYLQQILGGLKVAGFVKSRKGPGGGYALAVSPEEITLGAVVRAMDGQIGEISCVHATTANECACPDPSHCAIRESFLEVHIAILSVLDSTTFAQLRDRQLEATATSVFDFVI